jgi:hypothetical protein
MLLHAFTLRSLQFLKTFGKYFKNFINFKDLFLRVPYRCDIRSMADNRLQTGLVSLLVSSATPSSIRDIFDQRRPSARPTYILTSTHVLHKVGFSRYISRSMLLRFALIFMTPFFKEIILRLKI